jgi:hypothetical protein
MSTDDVANVMVIVAHEDGEVGNMMVQVFLVCLGLIDSRTVLSRNLGKGDFHALQYAKRISR